MRRAHVRASSAVLAVMAGVVAVGVGMSSARPAGATPAEVWRESFREILSVDLTAAETGCVAEQVGSVDGLVGPLLGAPATGGAGSVWPAMDECVTLAHRGEIARAIVLGGRSAEEPAVSAVWDSADELLGNCVAGAGGWQAIGSYEHLLAACASAVGR